MKPLTIYTWGTPNGHRTSVLLEELAAAYASSGFSYEAKLVNINADEHKEGWFAALTPNARIPLLVDPNRGEFKVLETAAIHLYLVQNYDPERLFSFDPEEEADEWSECVQWVMWVHGGLAVMQAQLAHFGKFCSEDVPYAINRYLEETKRLYGVLELRLSQGEEGRDYLAGSGRGKYSIADMNAFPWVRIGEFCGVDCMDLYPRLKAWRERVGQREAVKRALVAAGPP